MIQIALLIKATFNWEVIHASMPRKLDVNRACGGVPGLPAYVVQELNIGTEPMTVYSLGSL